MCIGSYTIICLLMKVQHVLLYDYYDFSGDGIEWINEPGNCYDDYGRVIPCPYLPDRAWAEYDVVCLPDEPHEALGPANPNRRRYPISNDCPKRQCKRRFHVGQQLVEDIFDAKSKCERINMRLVSIESKEKWEDVKEALEKAHRGKATEPAPAHHYTLPVSEKRYYYTSGMRDGNATFSWGSGCPFTFANWGVREEVRQPDNWNEDEYCVEIRGLHPHYVWSDYPCRAGPSYVNWWHVERRSYVCESLTCSPDQTDDYNPTTNDCDSNANCCGQRIYYVGQEDVNGVNKAQAKCEAMNMRLVSIETAEKWRDVLEAISNSGSSDKTRSYYTSGRRNGRDGSFSWGSGCPFDYTNWRSRNRAQDPERCNGPNCVAIQGGTFKWDDVECRNSVRSYICESLTCNLKAVPHYPARPDEPHETHGPAKPSKPSNPSEPSNPPKPAKPSNPSNPSKPANPDYPGNPDYQEFPKNNDCAGRQCLKRLYHIGRELVKSMYEGKAKCEAMNMRLASIESDSKSLEITVPVTTTDPAQYTYYYTSGRRDGKGDRFGWTGSGCPFTDTNWRRSGFKHQPDNKGGDEYCVVTSPDYAWNDSPCRSRDGVKRSYICEALTCSRKPRHDFNPTTNDCDNNDICCGKRTFHIGQKSVNGVYEAQAECEAMDMRLVSIETGKKLRDLLVAIANSGSFGKTKSYFTSAMRDGKNGSFSWSSGCPFTFTNWGVRNGVQQPDNWQGDEYCLELGADLTWNDGNCRNSVRSYICESLTCCV